MNNDKKYYIYKHQCKINGQIYIGQTCQTPNRRWREGEGYKKSVYFYSAIQKYGWDNFSHEIIETNLTKKEADDQEKYWINYYKSNIKGYGYNLTEGGLTNSGYTQEAKNKMSQKAHERFSNLEERQKQSKRLKQAYQKDSSRWNAIKKPIKCIETNEIFETITAAAKWAGVKSLSSFGNYFRGDSKSCGRHPETGQRLHWEKIILEKESE